MEKKSARCFKRARNKERIGGGKDTLCFFLKKLAIRDPFYKHRTAKYMSILAMPFPALPIRENVFRVRKMVFHHCARVGPGPPEKIRESKREMVYVPAVGCLLWVGEIAKLGKIGTSEKLL